MVTFYNQHHYSGNADIYFYACCRSVCYVGHDDNNHHRTTYADIYTIRTILSKCHARDFTYKFY